jgi:SAM-dependent methyltransferase
MGSGAEAGATFQLSAEGGMTGVQALRPDFERTRRRNRERRSPERLAAHYALERPLAERLREATPAERPRVYSEVYGELFAALPDHPQHAAKRTDRAQRVAAQLALLLPLLCGGRRYLEIGCSDAAVTFGMATHVRQAFGLDVTDALVDLPGAPANFRFLRTDGVHIPLPSASVDLVYSNQLLEHLHPDDAEAQLREVVRVLAPGGVHLCRTPNRLTGPHDISAYFDYQATGFHLREYDFRSLRRLMMAAGFSRVRFVVGGASHAPMPFVLAAALESLLDRLPPAARTRAARLVAPLLDLSAIARR